MNVLVTGANGQLGREMRIACKDSADNYIFTDICGDDVEILDITDADAVMQFVSDNDVKAIVNCAAYTNVDKAEDEEAVAAMLNAGAVGYLAEAAKANDALLVHISTDYVFGGEPYNTPCTEERSGTPTGAYGRTKLLGEQAVQASGCQYIIIRTSWLYSEYGRNFVKTMINLTSTKPNLQVVFDQAGTPTYALDLAKVIVNIIDCRKYQGNSGVYHYSNEGVCSWYDFAVAIAECAGNASCDIRPCHSDEFPSKVKRPAYSVLDKTKIKTVFGIEIPHWTHSLKECIKRLLLNNL